MEYENVGFISTVRAAAKKAAKKVAKRGKKEKKKAQTGSNAVTILRGAFGALSQNLGQPKVW